MMRVLCTVAVLMIATAAFAGSALTPQQAMEKTMNCPVCSAWTPDVSKNIRYDVFVTKTGAVESFMNADEASAEAFNKCATECERRAATIPTMSADQKAKLCPFCQAKSGMMGKSEVTMEHYQAHNGWITVTTYTSPAGQKIVQEYAAAMKNHCDLLEAAVKAQPETMKSKM
jgi:hypothetical protein